MQFPVSKPNLGARERELLLEVFDSGFITQGPMTRRFEESFARFVGAPFAVATTSGTTALHLALAAVGVGPGDEVIVPDLTYVASANAVKYAGATPVLVDVDATTYGLDAQVACSAITKRTRAIIAVHLYGHACDIETLRAVARSQSIVLIEDAAEGLGGFVNGKALGTFGDMGCFSFYGNKVMTTGEGGMVVTRYSAIDKNLRHLRGMAQTETRYFHDDVGFNYRMTDLQAALGVAQLERLPRDLEKRRAIIAQYHKRLYDAVAVDVLSLAPWLFTFQHPRRDELARWLSECGIETRPTFVPLHRMPMFSGRDEQFPTAVNLGDHGLSLPTYPELALSDVDLICDAVNMWN